jgi:hypothetical protein
MEDTFSIRVVIALAVANALAGLACAVLVAVVLRRADGKKAGVLPYFAALVGAYFIECVALAMGMTIPVFNVGLALAWGVLLGVRLRARASGHEALRAALFFALYSSLPAVSLLLVPVMALVGGWHIVSAEDGARFGIPSFVPWPAHTILGFYAGLAAGTTLMKSLITVGIVRLVVSRASRPHP